MHRYVIIYAQPGNDFLEVFVCWADDHAHAKALCLDAYPDAVIERCNAVYGVRLGRQAGDSEARFALTEVAPDLATRIERDGWDGERQSFEMKNRIIVETTGGGDDD